MDAKRALEAAGGDEAAAITALRTSGLKIAAKKGDRAVREGVIGTYLHANAKVAALVALACETDFVARTEDFKNLAHDLALHVTAANPQYLKPEEIPAAIIEQETAVAREQLKNEKKPEKMWDKILPGKLEKFYSETCLLNQLFVKDDSQTVRDLLAAATARLGENIQIQAFHRLSL